MKCSINGSYVTLVTYFITQFMIAVEKIKKKNTFESNFSEFRVTLFNCVNLDYVPQCDLLIKLKTETRKRSEKYWIRRVYKFTFIVALQSIGGDPHWGLRSKRRDAWWGGEGGHCYLQLKAKTWIIYRNADYRNSVTGSE